MPIKKPQWEFIKHQKLKWLWMVTKNFRPPSRRSYVSLSYFLWISFVILENLYSNDTLSSHFPVMIILVTGTHQYFIHNTLGGSKESPLPRIYRLLRMQEPFLFAILPQIYPISRKNHWKSHRPQAVTYFYIAYSIFFISLSVRFWSTWL